MPHIDRDRLREIKTFPALVKYLRDELEWPIEQESFDDLTYDYEPEELGLDAKTAAKIDGIKQLRPLDSKQPWGIFFLKFEPKSLPVVALRRILSQLVFKKRTSANKSDRQAWLPHDLLFISNYGEGETRQITFAHFSDPSDSGDLPTLKVLGWDEADSVLHLEHAHQTLKEKLHWPKDPSFVDSWRKNWASAFTLGNKEVINTTKDLCIRMAHLAQAIRKKVNAILAVESEKGPIKKLMSAFQQSLIHDLKEDDFADMYAQTITYGLLSAAVSRTAPGEGTAIVAENLTDMVPITNPFLRELLSTFLTVGGRKGKLDFDELGINDVVEALRQANMEAVLRDFNDKNPAEDPVIHFYELFLKEYDAKKRMQRGVFYTPKPVVSYIVRSVHEVLQTEFGLPDGLADTSTWAEMIKRTPDLTLPTIKVKKPNSPDHTDQPIDPNTPFVNILDPATGTATFLVEVIEIIHTTMLTKWLNAKHTAKEIDSLWNEYVPDHLLTRLYGFELMMAPYAIAHMKIGLKLFETGYKFASHERARIYLTNSLEPPKDFSDKLAFEAPALAHEAQAVNAVKRHQRFTVVVGNPPYSKSSQNQGRWIEEIMEDYKRTVRHEETQIQALSDDYAKFLRFGHFTLEQSHAGVFGFITNNGYLDGPLFRDMRSSMLEFFQKIWVRNLHGDSRKQFSPPDGLADENVFDIQQGVAITVFSRKHLAKSQTDFSYGELWGTRDQRYQKLQNSSAVKGKAEALLPTLPFNLFIPVEKELEAEFHKGWHLYDIFGTGNQKVDNHESYGAGFVTQQDKFAIGFSKSDVTENVRSFLDPRNRDDALWERFEFCSTDQWNFSRAKKELKGLDVGQLEKRCLYRPFDYRFTIFNRNICTILRSRITSQFDEENIALLTTRRVTRLPYNNVFATNTYAEYKIASHDRNTIVFPLWIRANSQADNRVFFRDERRLNLNPQLLEEIAKQFSLSQRKDDGLPMGITPQDIFNYFYACLHSPSYRSRYGEFLKIDFPRLPLTSNSELFQALAKLGSELIALHLLESPVSLKPVSHFVGKSNAVVEKLSYARHTIWLDKAQTTGFANVSEDIWNFHIGGYQVCEKWLKDRKGRTLCKDDIAHYQNIVVALSQTIRLMKEIDEVIDKHGGWPGAFMTKPSLQSAQDILRHQMEEGTAVLYALAMLWTWNTNVVKHDRMATRQNLQFGLFLMKNDKLRERILNRSLPSQPVAKSTCVPSIGNIHEFLTELEGTNTVCIQDKEGLALVGLGTNAPSPTKLQRGEDGQQAFVKAAEAVLAIEALESRNEAIDLYTELTDYEPIEISISAV